MTENTTLNLDQDDLPDANPRRKRISPVWLVPFIALVIAIALAVRAWQQQGEEIVIIFESAGGIEVGKTEVRLKDVPVGKVTRLRLNDDLSRVRATLSLDRSISHHLSDNTRFWLVTPRITTSGVSNLGTLVSGVYIVMDPGRHGESRSTFEGLTEPPAVQSDEKGTQFILRADKLGSLDVGSPVYYRQLRVGGVVNYQLSADGSHVDARIFVEAPYDRLVSSRSRFWNVSGVDVSVGVDGIKAQVESLSSLLLGGISFDSPLRHTHPEPAAADSTFPLYESHDAAIEGRFTLSYPYLLKFSHTAKGLRAGTPIEFRGIKVGQVIEVKLADVAREEGSIEVYISLEPQRFDESLAPTREQLDERLAELVAQGLRAQLKTGNLLLGSKFIDLIFAEDDSDRALIANEEILQIPTIDESPDKLEKQLTKVAEALSKFPVESIGQGMDDTLKSMREILKVFEQNRTAAKLDGAVTNVELASQQLNGAVSDARVTLTQLTQTLKSVDHTIAPDSQLHAEFLETLQAVAEASDSFDRFVEELYRYPNSLVFGLKKED